MASSARIDELRKKFDENPRRYFAPLANEYRKAGDLSQAVFICQEYLPQQPGHMSGHIVYGQALYEMGRPEEAQVVFETALSLDPENLIALRHLGDIARQADDFTAARGWYQRVLEADPRNEEIAQIMLTLLAAPEPAAGHAPAPTSRPTPVSSTAPTPLYTPAVPAATRPDSSTSSDSVSDGEPLFVEKSARAGFGTPTPVSTTASHGGPASNSFEGFLLAEAVSPESNRSTDNDLLDLDDFSIGGVAQRPAGADSQGQSAQETTPVHDNAALDRGGDAWSAEHGAVGAGRAFNEHDQNSGALHAGDESALGAMSDQGDGSGERATNEANSDRASHASGEPNVQLSALGDEFEPAPPTALPEPPAQDLAGAEPAETRPTPESVDRERAPLQQDLATAPFEDDPLAITAVPPLSTVEIGAGLGLEHPRFNSSAPFAFDDFHTDPFDARNAAEESSPSNVGPVDLASPIDFVALPVGISETAAAQPHDQEPTKDASDDAHPADASTAELAMSDEEHATSAAELEFADEPESSDGHQSSAAANAGDAAVPDPVASENTDGGHPNESVDDPSASAGLAEPGTTDRVTEFPESATVTSSADEGTTELASADAPAGDSTSLHQGVPDASAPDAAVSDAGAPDAQEATEHQAVPEAFVTETMAELYLQQGHLESALGIYHRLVEQRPGDAGLEQRMRAVEDQVHGTPAVSAVDEVEPGNAPAPVYGGPTIRDFLRGLAAIRPGSQSTSANGAQEHQVHPEQADGDPGELLDDDLSAGKSATGQLTEGSPVAAEPEHPSGAAAGNSLGARFAEPKLETESATPAPPAASAADVPPNEPAQRHIAEYADGPLHGLPAHRATSELSLDHVFKGNAPARSDADTFSLDRFFSNDAVAPDQNAAGDARVSPPATDDIAQFNAWLNGLKKT